MTTRRASLRAIAALCDEIGPEDGVDPRHVRRGRSKEKEGRRRRARQLCSQAEEAVHLAIGCLGDDGLRGLRVVGIEPAPDSSRLLVEVEVEAGDDEEVLGDARKALGRAEGVLRAAVASAVHRKRAPELTFRVAPRIAPYEGTKRPDSIGGGSRGGAR